MVAVGMRGRVHAVGVDLELVQPPDDSWGEICTPSEARRLTDLSESTTSPLDLFVVAKEAFYKCQHPLTGQDLSWRDVEIEVDETDPSFRVVAADRGQWCPVGFFAEVDPWISAVCVASRVPC